MSDILQFFIEMKGVQSVVNGYKQIASAAKQTFSSVTNSSNMFAHSLDGLKSRLKDVEFSRAGTRLKSEFRQLTQEAKSLERQIAKMEGRGSGSGMLGGAGIGGALKGLALAAGLTFGASEAFGVVKSSVQAANQFGAQKQSYRVLTGNNGIGDQLAEDLRGLKENTIMGPAVYKNAQTMLGFGVKANDVTKDLRMLGDISMGDANKLQHLTLAFSEVTASGRITGKEVRQFINAGFNPLKQISEMTGKSLGTVRDEMRKGAISSTMVQKAFEAATGPGGRFHDMLGKMAETSAGKTQIFEGRVASLKIALGERLQPTYMSTIDAMTSFVTWTKHIIEISPVQKIQDQINKIRGLQIELTSANTSHARQVAILKELQEINPNIVKGIDDQNIAYGKLSGNINKVVGALENKKIAEIITNDNSDLFDTVALYKNKKLEDQQEIMARLGEINDPRLYDPSLSFGKKQILGQHILQQRVNAEGQNFSLSATPNALLLAQLSGSISDYNRSQEFLDFNAKKVADATKKIDNARKIFEQMAGIGSMTPALPAKTNTKNGEVDDEGTAKGITSGGPRVININGLNMKLADKIEVLAANSKEFLDKLEPEMENFFLRVLNSGASVQ